MATIKRRWPLASVVAGIAMITLAGCFGLPAEVQTEIGALSSRLLDVEGRVESSIRDGSLSISDGRAELAELRGIRDDIRRIEERSGIPAWVLILSTIGGALTGTGGAGGLIARKIANNARGSPAPE